MPDLRMSCLECYREYPIAEKSTTCPACSGLLEVDYDYDRIAESLSPRKLASRVLWSMWRYAELLPVPYSPECSLGEGATPVARSHRLENEFDLGELDFKLEFTCPSGSFKDRGSTVLISRALQQGFSGVLIDSSGNAAASLATYAARANLKCVVLMPSKPTSTKLVQCISAGALVTKVLGTRQDTYEFAVRVRERARLFYCGFQTNPFALEGMKTMGYEICEQFDWKPPDWIVFPVGTGSALLGCFKAFTELRRLGWISKIPSIACIQPAGCAPISRAFLNNLEEIEQVTKPSSIAEGLLISNPVRGKRILSILRQTEGSATTVTEAEISDASRLLINREGLFVEPSAAVSFAGLLKLRKAGKITREDRVLCILTGSGMKTADFYEKQTSRTMTVRPDSDIGALLGRLGLT